MKQFFYIIALAIIPVQTTVYAAPIGTPGAIVGANKSSVGTEVNFLIDRNLDLKGPGDSVESQQIILKGELGLNKRVDLIVRLGTGAFKVNGPGTFDTDIGPLFGVGFKATWAELPDLNIKIGTVAQTVRLRGDLNGNRHAFTESDLAVGAYFDAPRRRTPRKNEITLLPYGGLVWSGIDIDGQAREEDAFGIFLGLAMKVGKKTRVGFELRIPEQTALTISASYLF